MRTSPPLAQGPPWTAGSGPRSRRLSPPPSSWPPRLASGSRRGGDRLPGRSSPARPASPGRSPALRPAAPGCANPGRPLAGRGAVPDRPHGSGGSNRGLPDRTRCSGGQLRHERGALRCRRRLARARGHGPPRLQGRFGIRQGDSVPIDDPAAHKNGGANRAPEWFRQHAPERASSMRKLLERHKEDGRSVSR